MRRRERAAAVCGPVERVVMQQDENTIGSQTDVRLDVVDTEADRGVERDECVLRCRRWIATVSADAQSDLFGVPIHACPIAARPLTGERGSERARACVVRWRRRSASSRLRLPI